MALTVTNDVIIDAYNKGQSISSMAREFHTYPTSIRRILKRNGVKLRNGVVHKGDILLEDGEKLIEWAKAQGRLVTKAELAEVVGKKRLSHSYFEKYPELGKYVTLCEQNGLQEYATQLCDWLQKNNISYKPNDKKLLGANVTARLLKPYENIVLQIAIKPKRMSQKTHDATMAQKSIRANEAGVNIIFLDEKHFENLDSIKPLLV